MARKRRRQTAGAIQHVGLRVMILAYRVAGLTFIQRAVLAAIASHADDAGRAWPGEELIAAETALTSRSVRTALRGLEALGIVKVARRGGRLPNRYAIQVQALQTMPKVTGTTCRSHDAERPAPEDTLTGTTGRMTGSTFRSHEAVRPETDDRMTGTSRQHDRNDVPPNCVVNGVINCEPPISPTGGFGAAAWLSVLNQETGAAFKPTAANLRQIGKRIAEGFTFEDAETVVQAQVRKWTGTQHEEHLRPSTLFGPKFDGYLQAARKASNGHGINASWDDEPAGEVTL
jgi:uncharacterized phage protein (TIGR02220 family)